MDAKFVFLLIRRMFRPFAVNHTCCKILHENSSAIAAPRFLQILNESLEIMKQTTNPGTFFCRYNTALGMAERIIESSLVEEHICYAEEISDWLQLEADSIAMDFVDRCKAKGNLLFVQNELFANDTVFSEKGKAYLSDVLEQIEQECSPRENGLYRYCSVTFTEHGKIYYYKTLDSSLVCGDEVVVPVGSRGKQSVGVITNIELFTAEDAPFPPAETKSILAKA